MVCAAPTNMTPITVNDPDVAWNELQQAALLSNAPTNPPAETFVQQHAGLAVVAADKARDYLHTLSQQHKRNSRQETAM